MQVRVVNAWLRKKVLAEALFDLGGALVAAGAGLALLAATVAVAHFFFWTVWRDFGRSGVNWRDRLAPAPAGWTIAFSLIVVALLFAGHAWTQWQRRQRRAELLGEDPRALPALMKREDPAVEILTDLLFAGPRLLAVSWDMLRKSVRLLRLDVIACSRILALLLTRNARFSFREICAALPDLNPTTTLPQLRDVVGVVFLTHEPSGLSLTNDLREELFQVLQIAPSPPAPRSGNKAATAPETTPRRRELQPLETLGLEPSASLAEVEQAYRRLIKESDPTRVAGLGPELEEIAREKAEDIYQAYRALLEKHDERK